MNNYPTPFELNNRILRNTMPSMRYYGQTKFTDFAEAARKKLTELVGLDKLVKTDLCVKIEYDKQLEDFREIRFTFQSEAGYRVPCHLLIPNDADKPLPVMICLQGHSKGMHISLARKRWEDEDLTNLLSGERDFAIQAVNHGYCAVTVEQRNFGECGGTEKGPDCTNSALTALLTGRTTVGERVWDVSRTIDVLEQSFTEFVDVEMIACMGNSGGGTTTYYAVCLEPRIKAAIPSCALCTYADSIGAVHHCACNYIPNIASFFDMGDLAVMIAPRPLIVVSGKDDGIFPLNGVHETFDIIQRLYSYAGAPDKCRLVVGNEGHRFYAAQGWAAFNDVL